MSRSSDRGAIEPTAALVAVFAICVGVTLYAGVLESAVASATPAQNRAASSADAVERQLSTAGIVHPNRIVTVQSELPRGYEGNVTIATDDRWTSGPTPPPAADGETRLVSVRVGPGTIRRGRLSVRVWR
jgi:hypothetical protein